MAHYASKCVQCTDSQKKCIRTRLKDENGNKFYEKMYECGNSSCKVNKDIAHIQRDIEIIEIKKKGADKHEEDHYYRTGTRKRRTHHRKNGGE